MTNPFDGVTVQDLANCAALARQGLHNSINDGNIPDAALIELTTNIAHVSAAAKALKETQNLALAATDQANK